MTGSQAQQEARTRNFARMILRGALAQLIRLLSQDVLVPEDQADVRVAVDALRRVDLRSRPKPDPSGYA